jgi:general stress protein 26
MVRIPDSHRHLLEGNVDVILTTISKNGFPHSSMIWCSYDGENVLLNTGVGYQKERNMRRNSNVSVFAYDPKNPMYGFRSAALLSWLKKEPLSI